MTELLTRFVTVAASISAAPVEAQDFGEVLFIAKPGTLGAGFTERVRRYLDAATIAVDLLAGDITASVAAALNVALGQNPRTVTLAVGRIDASVGAVTQAGTITFAGTTATAGDRFVIDLDGESLEFIAVGGETPTAMATAVEALLTADSRFSSYGLSPSVGVITIDTNPTWLEGIDQVFAASTNSAGITVATAITTPSSGDVEPELALILAADDAWYGITSEYLGTGWQKDVAIFAEANNKLHMAQTMSQLALDGDSTSLTEVFAAADYDYSAACYHHTADEYFAYNWAVRKLGVDPDVKSTDWAWATLSGITYSSAMTVAESQTLATANANYYQKGRGINATAPPSVVASGLHLGNRVTIDWSIDRFQGVNMQLLLDASAQELKIPYTNPGFSQVRAVNLTQAERGISTSHYANATNAITGVVTSPVVTVPRRNAVSVADEAARRVPVTIELLVAGAVQQVATTIYLSTSA